MIADFRNALRANLTRAIQQVQDATGSGAAGDWADYRYRVGVVTGLRRAMAEAEELYLKFMNDEEG